MSRRSPATIGLVCEGESDFVLLGAVARTLWPAATRVRRLHPEVDELTGYAIGASGWTGVRAWCEKNAAFAKRQAPAFLEGRSSPDFAPEDYELGFAGRASPDDLTPLGQMQMGLRPWA